MGSNSIYGEGIITPDSIVNEVRMTLSAKPDTPIIIVEGEEDIALFKTIKSEQTILLESHKGKPGVFEVVEKCNNLRFIGSVIGICDRDFDANEKPEVENIFYCDYSCLEMMVFSNDGVYQKVLEQIGVDSNVFPRASVLHYLESITLLRKSNDQNGSGLNFEGVRLSKHYNKPGFCIILEKLISTVDLCSKKLDKSKRSKIYNQARSELRNDRTENELQNLTQGHDFIELLRDLNKRFAKKKMSEDTIRVSMNSAFTLSAFIKTKLYLSISSYSTYSYFRTH